MTEIAAGAASPPRGFSSIRFLEIVRVAVGKKRTRMKTPVPGCAAGHCAACAGPPSRIQNRDRPGGGAGRPGLAAPYVERLRRPSSQPGSQITSCVPSAFELPPRGCPGRRGGADQTELAVSPTPQPEQRAAWRQLSRRRSRESTTRSTLGCPVDRIGQQSSRGRKALVTRAGGPSPIIT